jgi:hypothetical protein
MNVWIRTSWLCNKEVLSIVTICIDEHRSIQGLHIVVHCMKWIISPKDWIAENYLIRILAWNRTGEVMSCRRVAFSYGSKYHIQSWLCERYWANKNNIYSTSYCSFRWIYRLLSDWVYIWFFNQSCVQSILSAWISIVNDSYTSYWWLIVEYSHFYWQSIYSTTSEFLREVSILRSEMD